MISTPLCHFQTTLIEASPDTLVFLSKSLPRKKSKNCLLSFASAISSPTFVKTACGSADYPRVFFPCRSPSLIRECFFAFFACLPRVVATLSKERCSSYPIHLRRALSKSKQAAALSPWPAISYRQTTSWPASCLSDLPERPIVGT